MPKPNTVTLHAANDNGANHTAANIALTGLFQLMARAQLRRGAERAAANLAVVPSAAEPTKKDTQA